MACVRTFGVAPFLNCKLRDCVKIIIQRIFMESVVNSCLSDNTWRAFIILHLSNDGAHKLAVLKYKFIPILLGFS